MQISCESIHTGAIAEARIGDGGLTWWLDPDHFTARLTEALALLLSKIACHWRREGTHGCPVILSVYRTPMPAPALVVDRPGMLTFAFDVGEVTEQGAQAFERAMHDELTHWRQLVA